MDRWLNKIAVVTGASSGIGAAIAVDLVKAGMIVVGLARRLERVEELKIKIPSTSTGALHPFKCDLGQEEEVRAAFKWIIETFGGVDVLVNNAGVMIPTNLIDLNNTRKIKKVIDTNLMAVVYCTREAFHSMKQRDVDGHVITINSILGHNVPYSVNTPLQSFNIYPATKFGITAMTETYRQEFQRQKTKIKITSISPGTVKTDLVFGHVVPEAIADMLNKMPTLQSEDISAAVLYVLGTPPHVQVHELILKPMGEMF